jgi:hypothetical protein
MAPALVLEQVVQAVAPEWAQELELAALVQARVLVVAEPVQETDLVPEVAVQDQVLPLAVEHLEQAAGQRADQTEGEHHPFRTQPAAQPN